MGLIGLSNTSLKLILLGGKGGVGKTTCASSTGLYLSKEFKTLLISTDPAHSLGDSLGQDLRGGIKEVKGVKNLSALELSAEKALSEFKMRYESQIKGILDTSTYLDQEDIASLFALPLPGIDEVMGLKRIVDLMEEGKFDKYVVDTAPTGHALRLLTLPELLDDWIKVMAKMRWKYRYMVTTFRGRYKADESDEFLVEMKKTVKRIEGLLRDRERCEFIAVTIPENMAMLETERLIKSLNRHGMKVRQLIINNVVPESTCPFCQGRREEQEKYIREIKDKWSDLKTIVMTTLRPQEVQGIESLENFKEVLFQS